MKNKHDIEADNTLKANLLDATMDSIFVSDLDGNVLYVNDTAYKTRGYKDKNELIGKNLNQLLVPEYAKLIKSRIKEILKKGEATFESEHYRKDGSVIPVEVHSRVIESAGQTLLLSVNRDISARKESEQRFLEEKGLTEAVMNSLPGIFYLFDPAGNMVRWNKNVEKVFGYKTGQIKDMRALDFVPAHFLDSVTMAIQEVISKGNATVEAELMAKDGTCLPFFLSGSLLRTKDAIYVIGTGIDLSEKRQAEEKLERNYDIQRVINTLLSLSLEDVPLDEILQRTLDLILSIPWLAFEHRGAIFIVEDATRTLVMRAESGLGEPLSLECARVPFGHCLCGRAALHKRIEFASRIVKRHTVRYEGMTPHGHYCVPIVSSIRMLGVINIYTDEGHRRSQREEQFLTAVSNTIAGIIIRIEEDEKLKQTMEELEETIEGTIQAMAMTVETRDPYTSGHQERVALLTKVIAEQLGLSVHEVAGIYTAALIHDIGKISVPAEILTKPGRLSKFEFNIIKTHSESGHTILIKIKFPWPIAQIVLQHHERIDGSGYPKGLKGDEIVLGARIIAVADVIEAMASHRPYRSAIGIDLALKEVTDNKGKLYDAEVVDACMKVFNHGFTFHQ